MAIKKITIYQCDLCGSEYDPQSVQPSEFGSEIVSYMRIDGYYKPDDLCKVADICKDCSDKIISLITDLRAC